MWTGKNVNFGRNLDTCGRSLWQTLLLRKMLDLFFSSNVGVNEILLVVITIVFGLGLKSVKRK